MFNIPEKRSPYIASRISHDKTLVVKLIQAVSSDIEFKDAKVLRLGKINREKPRPTKVIFRNDLDARKFTMPFSRDLVAATDEAFSDISISRDRTLRESQHLVKIRSELDSRIKKGEKNLTIKYCNGIPEITNLQ